MLESRRYQLFIVIFFFVWVAAISLANGIFIPLGHLDGAFQTASGLFRISRGETLGHDFYAYLGIGPLFLHWPIFNLLGGTLSASVVASQFLTLACFLTASSLIVRLLLPRSKSSLLALSIGCILVLMTWYAYFVFLNRIPALSEMFGGILLPGNSIRPIRSVLPFLAGWSFYCLSLLQISPFKSYGIAAGLLALFLLWSNDYAIPTFLIFGVGYAILARTDHSSPFTKSRDNHRVKTVVSLTLRAIRRVLPLILVSAALYLLILTLITRGHPIQWLKYNYVDLRSDQWWYFSPYDSSSRIFRPADFFVVLAGRPGRIALLLFGISPLFSLAATKHTIRSILVSDNLCIMMLVGLVLFSSGLLSALGGHYSTGYFVYFGFYGLFASIVILLSFSLGKRNSSLYPIFDNRRLSISRWVGIVSLAFVSLLSTCEIFRYGIRSVSARNNSAYVYQNRLGGFIPNEYNRLLERLAKYQGRFQEEYFGLAGAYLKSNGFFPVDSVIHFFSGLRQGSQLAHLPEVVVLTNPHFSSWQSWSFSQNWWFYENILKNYQPLWRLPSVVIYRRSPLRDANVLTSKYRANCGVVDNSVVIGDGPKGLYSIDLEYLPVQGRGLILIQNHISIPNDSPGYVSIDPSSGAARVPVVKLSPFPVRYNVILRGFHASQLQLKGCKANYITDLAHPLLAGAHFRSSSR